MNIVLVQKIRARKQGAYARGQVVQPLRDVLKGAALYDWEVGLLPGSRCVVKSSSSVCKLVIAGGHCSQDARSVLNVMSKIVMQYIM